MKEWTGYTAVHLPLSWINGGLHFHSHSSRFAWLVFYGMQFLRKWHLWKTVRKSASIREVQRESLMNIYVIIPKTSTSLSTPSYRMRKPWPPVYPAVAGTYVSRWRTWRTVTTHRWKLPRKSRKLYRRKQWRVRSCNSNLPSADAVEVCLSNMCFKPPIWKSWKRYYLNSWLKCMKTQSSRWQTLTWSSANRKPVSKLIATRPASWA